MHRRIPVPGEMSMYNILVTRVYPKMDETSGIYVEKSSYGGSWKENLF